MKRFTLMLLAAAVTAALTNPVLAQDSTTVHGSNFVDANGDGINDNAPDHDGDGIPNGQDPDYEKQGGNGKGRGQGFVDMDGDGINDLMQDDDGDGVANGQDPDYIRPQDGSGPKWKHGQSDMGGGQGNDGSGSGSGTGSGHGRGHRGGRGK